MKLHNGFTLVELMMSIAVMAIILTVAVPGMKSYLDTNLLRGGTSQFYADVQLARSESIKRNVSISVSITSDGAAAWCYGLDEDPGCDCTLTNPADVNACTLPIAGVKVLKVGGVSDFTDINMTAPVGVDLTYATFDPTRGLATTTGTAIFQSTSNSNETHVAVSVLGRVSSCTPAGANQVAGYSAC